MPVHVPAGGELAKIDTQRPVAGDARLAECVVRERRARVGRVDRDECVTANRRAFGCGTELEAVQRGLATVVDLDDACQVFLARGREGEGSQGDTARREVFGDDEARTPHAAHALLR